MSDYYAFVRQALSEVQGAIDTGEIEQGQETLTHHFADGVYGRQMNVSKGSLVVSKMHRHSTLNVFLSGRVSLIAPDGVVELSAPCVLVSPKAGRRVQVSGLLTE